MKKNLDNKFLLKYSRQIVLKDVGVIGQKKIINSKVLVVGAGGLGSPVIDLLARAGVGQIGVIEFDKIGISNIHRQTLYTSKDINKNKSQILKRQLKLINNNIKLNIYNERASDKNLTKILLKFDVIVDGSDNFHTCLLYTSPSPRDATLSRMPSSA